MVIKKKKKKKKKKIMTNFAIYYSLLSISMTKKSFEPPKPAIVD